MDTTHRNPGGERVPASGVRRAESPAALEAVVDRLRCPHCGARLAHGGAVLICAGGHSYDVARQGHVTLPAPRGKPPKGDTAEMVAARVAFLAAGHYAPITDAIVGAAWESSSRAAHPPACVIDVGAGTGHHLAAVLDALPAARGIALDASRPALRRAVRGHPRIAGVACDVWRALPLGDGSADLVLNAFAPRDAGELPRILAPGGALIVVTPAHDHLAELVASVGMLRVGQDKQDRLRSKLSPRLTPVDSRAVRFDMTLTHAAIQTVVAMSPTAHHVEHAQLVERVAKLPDPLSVCASVVVDTFAHA